MDFRFSNSNGSASHPAKGVNSARALTFVDLFAGCGGLSLGLLEAGLHGLFAVERDKIAFSTLEKNLISGNIGSQLSWPAWISPKRLAISTFLRMLREDVRLHRYLKGVDLLAGGPPCQGFSFAGKRDHGDPRNRLFKDYLKVVASLKPRMLLIENVTGITVSHGINRMPFARKIQRALHKLGYETSGRLHRASEFGVPQERPRYLIVGILRSEYAEPDLGGNFQKALDLAAREMLKQKGLADKLPVTVKDALSDLKTTRRRTELCPDAPRRYQLKYQQPKRLTPYQSWLRRSAPSQMNSMRLAKHSKRIEKKFSELIKRSKANGRRGVTLHSDDMPKAFQTKKYGVVVLHPQKPSHTLTTLPDDLIHFDEPRILTVREYARLQSFPDWFAFHGKYTTGGERRRKECPRYTQVGNAVAPFVAEAFGRALLVLATQGYEKRLRP